MKTDKFAVTETQLAAYTRREHDLFRRVMEGTLPIERVLAGLQDLVEGKFVAPGVVRTLADMLAAGKYSYLNPNITEKNFPVNPALYTIEGSKLYHFNKRMKTAQVFVAIRADGYEPDGLEKLLAYGAEHPEEQRKYPIIGLGSSWVDPGGDRNVPYLGESDRERYMDLDWDGPGGEWDEHCRFLASPQVQR